MSDYLDLVKQTNYGHSQHELRDKFDKVDQVLEQFNCTTVANAQEFLSQKFDYNRVREAVRQILHRLGYSPPRLDLYIHILYYNKKAPLSSTKGVL